jgi:hypothetical protein
MNQLILYKADYEYISFNVRSVWELVIAYVKLNILSDCAVYDGEPCWQGVDIDHCMAPDSKINFPGDLDNPLNAMMYPRSIYAPTAFQAISLLIRRLKEDRKKIESQLCEAMKELKLYKKEKNNERIYRCMWRKQARGI